MTFKFTFLFFFISLISFSQTTYLDKAYQVEKTTHIYTIIKKDSLKLDFYKPINASELTPLLIYVHGGSFSGGQRDDQNSVQFANEIAQRGYAVASISYRLIMKKLGFDCNTKTKEKIKALNTASEDISYAIKYFIENETTFNINPEKIVLSGTSSGAEAVLNLAYVYKNRILPKKFELAGLISMAGALTTLEHINIESAIPTQLFHGTNDNKVPYHIAAHHYCNENDDGYLILYGSKAIANRLKGLGKTYYLFSINGGTHSWSGMPMHLCVSEVVDFLYYDIINARKRQTERTIGF